MDQKAKDLIENYEIPEVCAMIENTCDELMAQLLAVLELCQETDYAYGQGNPMELLPLMQKLQDDTFTLEDGSAKEAAIILQGAIIGFAHTDGETLNKIGVLAGKVGEKIKQDAKP